MDELDRLYAGALLGASLTKQVGEVGAQDATNEESTREATVEAGVASGKVKGSELGSGDAALLEDALTKQHVKIPSSPFSAIGGLFGNLAKGAGEFVENLRNVPQGIFSMGKGIEESVLQAGGNPDEVLKEAILGQNKLGEMGRQQVKQTIHEFSSPQQIYEHPFGPLMDIASVAAPIAGGAIRGAGALSRAGVISADEGSLASKVIGLGSTLGREDAIASPGFTAENAEKLAEAGAEAAKIPRAYSPNLGVKYGFQKPLDWGVSKLKEVNIPGLDETVGDLQGKYFGNKLINTTRAQISAGTAEEFMNSPVQQLIDSTGRMFGRGQGAGAYQFEATMLHSMGINDLDKLDQYVQRLREGEDIDGLVLSPDMEKMAAYRAEQLYQDPRFRQLIEQPTDLMKEVAYQLRRVNVDQATKLEIAPTTSEDSALGRLRVLTNKSNEELRSELPASMRPFDTFAKGLQTLQDVLMGKPTADLAPSIPDLAYEIPYGTVAQKQKLMEQVVESFKADQEDKEPLFDRMQNPEYIQGNNLFDKIATGLHDQLGVDPEQAQSFARGVALGSPDGPILPTYVPSVSGEKLKFGLEPEAFITKLKRAAGVGKFDSLDDVERQPGYYDFKRPFNPRTASAQTIGLGPSMNYMNDATYGRFLQGTMRLDPEAIIRNAYQINKDLVTGRLNEKMIDALAVKGPDGVAKLYPNEQAMFNDLGTEAARYQFVPVDTWRNFFKTKNELEMNIGEAMKDLDDRNIGHSEYDLISEIEGLTDEAAQRFVMEEESKVAQGQAQGVALPTSYVKTIIAHARISEQGSAIARSISFITGRWKSAVLSYMPSWLLRTTLGHGVVALIDGTVNPKFWAMAHDYFSDRPILPEHLKEIAWGDKYGDTVLNPDDLPYGVNQGSMIQELADIGEGRRIAKQSAVPRAITRGVHTTTNFQRRAIFLRNLDRGAKQRLAELGRDFDHPGGFWNSKNIDAVLDPQWRAEVLKYPDLVEHAFDQLSHASYTFGQMAPWERRVVKYAMPFYGWYKFISKFVWSMPMNYPGRSLAIAMLGRIGEAEHEKLGPIPDYLEGALWFNTHDLSNAQYINLYGLNPMGDVANPFGKEGAVENMVSAGQMSPIIQAITAAYGINPVTGAPETVSPTSGVESGLYGKLVNVNTGEEVPNIGTVNPISRMVGTFLRSFPEIRAAELVATQGNPVYPESIPLLHELPEGVEPNARHGYAIPSILEQEFGVQPRSYNIDKHAAELLKTLKEARKSNEKSVAKEKAKLSSP